MDKLIILDGATGTMLQAAGMRPGEHPSVYGTEHSDILCDLHRRYIEAGSRVILSDTFGANAEKLAPTGKSVSETVACCVAAAKKAAEDKALVALSIGPVGTLMEPFGTLTFDRAYEIFAEMITAGEKAGADIIYFETMTDLSELRAGVLAAKENSSLPVWASMSFENSERTFFGTDVRSFAVTLDGLGVSALGVNCTNPADVVPLIREIRRYSSLPVIAKPNAGLPDPVTGTYGMNADDFFAETEAFVREGAEIIGGCCGTSPEFIRKISGIKPVHVPSVPREYGVCSASRTVSFDGIRVIGERINPTGKPRLAQALRDRDMNYIKTLALKQEEAGADILDINVGVPGEDEAALMSMTVRAVQSVCALPLQIDSSNPAAVEAGLRACAGRGIVNSVDASPEKLSALLPIVKKYGAAVIGLTLDKSGIPDTSEERLRLAEIILDAALSCGIAKESVLIDCLTLTVSAQQSHASVTLDALRLVRERLGLSCVLGVSNISFGLPSRDCLTAAFLTQAIACGLTLPIVNPNCREVMDAISACRVLSGEDTECKGYIGRFASVPVQEKTSDADMTVEAAVRKGLGEETAAAVRKLLLSEDELQIVNTRLIPALDAVGKDYESGVIFLPQLISSANAACCGFEIIRERIASRGGTDISKGDIVLATVEGDIHDIGKNIVRVVLENYGFRVFDLGRDVPPQRIVEAAKEKNVRLVGLSALMTTTVPAMKRTIEALRNAGCDCRVMVGGAVLTAEYARLIGADYYTKDASASVRAAQEVYAE